ncbi:hypothetical protein EHO61_11545 [Leptospira fluminis]|uniref:Uncharacterized protein n=1 Tax=Leptospira fluminis TaxID=2484979 RepID=A0A4R9GPM4_9LEPT|nr:hypothetical protein [Leptospira fluminis]TGK18080.1 hypothetical protein EHO61_11545 [Leptospira fluminis]
MQTKKIEDLTEDSEWRKLNKDTLGFFRIVRTLNRYYDSIRQPENIDPTSFRKRLVDTVPEKTEIFFKKFGSYEYLVFARIFSRGKSESDSWIHIDGIRQEQDDMRERAVPDHPVFSIRCLSDIYEDSCTKVTASELESIDCLGA